MDDLWRHRSWQPFRHGLDERAQALFEPGERIVATFDGVTRHPWLRWLGQYGLVFGTTWAVSGYLFPVPSDPHWRREHLVIGLGFAAAGLGVSFVCWLRGSRVVMVALTSLGVVECSLDLLRRPRAVLRRGPVAKPHVVSRTRRYLRVAIGAVQVCTLRRNETLLEWAALPWSTGTPTDRNVDPWKVPLTVSPR